MMNLGAIEEKRTESTVSLGNSSSAGLKVNYSIRPAQPLVMAKFGRDGKTALCGTCNHSIGEFEKVDGTVLCKNKNGNKVCYTKNKIIK